MRLLTFSRFCKMRIVILFTFLCTMEVAYAAPTTFSYQGRILSSVGASPGFTMASFSFSVMIDKAGGKNPNCTIFREQKDLVPLSTDGLFDVAIGEGTANFPNSSSKVYDYMNNSGTVSCAEGGTFLLSASDKRFLDVQFNPNGTAGWNHITPASEIRAVPYATNAISAEKLGGLVATDYIRKTDLTGCTAGQFVTYNGSAFGCDTPAGGGSSFDASYSIKGLVQFLTNAATSGIVVTNGVAQVNTGTGANQIVKLDGAGKLPAVDGSALTGIVASSATTATTAGSATNFSGSLTGDVSGTQSATSVDKIKGMSVVTTGAVNGKVLKYSSGTLVFADDDTGTTPTSVANFTGSLVGDVSGTQGATSVDKIKGAVVDTTGIANGKILKYDGTKWVMSDDATGGSPADSSYAAKGVVQFDTSATVSGITVTAGLAKVNAGTGASQIVQLDSSGKLPAVDGSALTNIVASSLSGILSIAKGGTGQSTKQAGFDALSPLAAKGSILTHDGTNNVSLAVGSTNGYVLMVDSAAGTGIKWAAPTATDLTTITGTGIVQRTGAGTYAALGTTAPINVTGSNIGLAYSTGLTTSSGSLVVDTGTTASKIVQLDSSAKLPAVDGSALTNIVASSLSGTLAINKGGTGQTTKTAAFDTLSPNTTKGDLIVFNGTNNTRLPAGTDGQVLSADSTNANGVKWIAAPSGSVAAATTSSQGIVQIGSGIAVSSGTISADPANFPSAVPVAKGGTGAATLTTGQILIGNGTGAVTSLACTTGQTISFNASGVASCSTPGASSAFVNGGNTFGAASSIGNTDAYDLTIKTTNLTRMTVAAGGNVGVGTSGTINDKLEVNGTIRGVSVSNTGTTIDWSKGNSQYTTAGCTGTQYTFSNMRDGGVYTLAITGTFSSSCTFGQTSPDTLSGTAGSGNFYFLPANSTPSGGNSVYSFMRVGTSVYVTWNSGFAN